MGDISFNHLIWMKDRQRGEVLLIHRDGQWIRPNTKQKVHAQRPPERSGCALWWATGQHGSVHLERPAVQVIDFSQPNRWNELSDSRCILGGKYGPAVLVFREGEQERWFGVVTLEKQGTQVDPFVSEEATRELEPGPRPIHSVLPPDWIPRQLPTGICLRTRKEIDSFMRDALHPQVIKRVQEILDRVPSLRTRLDLEHSAGHTFEQSLVENLLRYPAFRDGLEAERTALLKEVKDERRDIENEIASLREKKLKVIGSAIEELMNDDRALAIGTVLGLRKDIPRLDVTEIVAALREISSRPLPAVIDTDVLASAIPSNPQVDLAPLVAEISHFRQDIQKRNLSSTETSTPRPGLLDASGRKVSSQQELAEIGINSSQLALLAIGHSGLLPIACGGFAVEAVHSLLQLIVAGRGIWWHCSSDASSMEDILQCPRVSETLELARKHHNRLFAIVLEGIDRAPTEAYLEPLLVMRALNLPLGSTEKIWPSNLLLFATMTSGGSSVVPVAPGVWRRGVPVVAEQCKVREPKEIAVTFWKAAHEEIDRIDMTGMLPTGVVPLNIDKLSQSASRLHLSDHSHLAKGLAVASCCARGDDTKPPGDYSAFGVHMR